jgi:hypothetical protein
MGAIDTLHELSALRDEEVFAQATQERHRQRSKWGLQSLPNGTGRHDDWQVAEFYKATTDHNMQDGTLSWRDVLTEEVFEAFAETDTEALRTELIQVIAVAAAWIGDLDGNGPAASTGNA